MPGTASEGTCSHLIAEAQHERGHSAYTGVGATLASCRLLSATDASVASTTGWRAFPDGDEASSVAISTPYSSGSYKIYQWA